MKQKQFLGLSYSPGGSLGHPGLVGEKHEQNADLSLCACVHISIYGW